MSLMAKLQARREAGRPVKVGLIGAGKFGSMFLAQLPRIAGLELAGIADLDPDRARTALSRTHWPDDAADAVFITDSGADLIERAGAEVVIEATGNPIVGIHHARLAFAAGCHVVMVNVEADVLAGPMLAQEAARAGVCYSMASGDQPALVGELVDWARHNGFEVVAAGKGTKYLPTFHASTPETVWGHYGLTPEEAAAGGMNPQMFNSFLDGTKSSIEMAAIANATGLLPPEDGLAFPPCGTDDLPHILRPREEGGQLDRKGTVEVVSSVERDGRPVYRDLRWGVYVVFEAPTPYAARCFKEYGLLTDSTGRYAAMVKPYHLIGLELATSVLSCALRGEPTGSTERFAADVVAVAKTDLAQGTLLDGEGGATVWGKVIPAARSTAMKGVPIGLAQGLPLRRPVAAGAMVTEDDIDLDEASEAVALRRAMAASL
ncbi:MAG: SAF domain-containing protein [Alphaproteobacteria bacterium]|nr:SAF domain-containing protein [Alphaproteobacteria bacterium]